MVHQGKREQCHLWDVKVEQNETFGEDERKRKLAEIPEEIREYKECIAFNEEKMKKLIKMNVEKMTIGEVKLDDDEKAALSLNPNFAILRYLDSEENERDIELGLTKIRYEVRNIEERKKIGDVEYEAYGNKRVKLDAEIIQQLHM